MPDAVKWLLPIVVGESWPEGDETKLRALRDAWHTASSAIGPVSETGGQAASGIRDNWTGDGADAFAEQWKKFVEGDEAYFKQLADAAKALGDSCDQTALDVEYTKYMIIISLIVLAAQIAAMIAAAAVTFGGSTAGIAPAQIATRMTVQMLFRQLLEKLAQQGFKQVAKELLEKLLKQGLKKIGMEVLKNEAINLGMDAGIQGLQMAKGDRKDWDWSKTSDAAISGAVGGVVGAASGSIGRGATEGLSHSAGGQIADAAMRAGARGAVEGVAQTVGQAAVTGELGSLTPEQLLMGASSGAVGGAVGGAKEQMHSVHEANIPRADADGDSGASGASGDSGRDSRRATEESSSASEPESRGESSSEPESRGESASRGESSSEPESRREAASEPESRGEEPRREAASAPESRGEEPRHEASSAPESRGEAASEPETRGEQPRHEAPAEPESRGEEPRREVSSEAASQREAPAAEARTASEPDVRRETEPQQRADSGPQPVSEHRAPEAPRPSADHVQQPTGGTSSQGGYGMAPPPPGFAPEPGRQSAGGRPQDNVGAAGFTSGPSQPFAAEGGAGPFQNGPSPQQAPPPGGFPPPPPPGGLPNAGGPGRASGPGPRPGGQPTPQVGGDQPRRVPPQDPRRMLQGGQPPMPQSGYRPGGQRPHGAQPGGQPLHGAQPGGQPPHGGQPGAQALHGGQTTQPGSQPPHGVQPGGQSPPAPFSPQPLHGAQSGGQPPHSGQAQPHGAQPGGQVPHNGQPIQPPHGAQPAQPGGQPPHNGQSTHPVGQPPHGPQPGQLGSQPPHNGQPTHSGGQPPHGTQPGGQPPHRGQPLQGGGQAVPPGAMPPHGSQPGARPLHGGVPPVGANGQPSQGGVAPQDPRRMPPHSGVPPQGGQRPPMGGGQRPAGYPNQPRGQQGPGGRPPMPPPPGGRPPVPPHDPRLGPPRPAGPPQVPPPRFGPPQEQLPPRGPFEPPRPPEQPRMQRPFEQPAQDRPIPAAEPTQQPVAEQSPVREKPGEHTPVQERSAEPGTERPDQRTPGQDHASEQPERPTEHQTAEHEPPAEHQTAKAEHPTDQDPSAEAPADSPREHDYGHDYEQPGHDEPYLTDPRFHTDDPAGIRRIEDTFMDSGHHSPVDGEWRHEQVRREALAKRDEWHPGMSDGGAVAVHAYTRYEMVGPLNHALRMGGPELPHLAPQAAALVSGLNELPPHEGVVSRRVDFKGDLSRLQAFLARFHDGAHITEPSFLSSSKVDAQHPRSKFPGEVEMRIQSKTGRDVEGLASIRDEHEVLFKAGTQFKITGIEEGPGHPNADPRRPGEPHYVVHAEEIAPGEPGHLGEADARDAIEQRRAEERADEARRQRESDEELEQFYAEHPEYRPSGDLAGKLNAFDPPGAEPLPERRPPATGEPDGGWSQLAAPLAPGGPPVLHAGSVETPQQHARLVRDAVPELGGVNTRNHYSPDGLENGYRTNAAESMVAFERRMNGEDVVAGPARQQSVSEQLGGPWSSRDSFDGVARELGERPVGARSAVAFETPGGESRLVAAVHTEHGVLFADPVSGRLAELPHDATAIHSMPLGGGDAPPHHVVETETIDDRLNPAPERLPHDEGYLFDGEHRGTPADHESIRRAVGDEDVYQQIHDRALARRDAAGLPVTDEGAVALHGYTRGEYAYDVNEALRRGPGHPGFDLAQQNTRAIMDGLNQVARESGETIRAYDVGGDPRLAELVAAPYEPGSVVVEPAFSSASIKTGEFSTSKFGDDVELHVRSDNLRDISKLAENPGERESLSPPGTQLLVHEKRLEISPEGRRKWVVVAEEIGPGHPRYLEPEAAQQKMAERRAENEHNAAEFERRKQAAIMERLGGLGEPEHVTPHQPSVHDLPEAPAETPPAPVSVHDYSRLARATNPPAEPAIHAGGTTPSERAAYVQDRHPHLREVNPGFREPGAFENGYVTNCTRGPEAYMDRQRGGDMTAEPILPHEMGSRGTLEHLEGRFGETFSARDSYDDVIREMRGMPVDHHAVVAVKYEGPNGVEYGHVAMVVHTREGVAFIDPQSGDLMHLPQPPKSIKVMHVGTPDEVHIGTEHGTGEHGGYGTAAPHDAFLARDDVAAALDGHADADYIRAHLAEHPGLVRVLSDPANDYLTRSLLDNPKTLASLLKHPEAIPILEDAVHEVNERGYSVIDDVEHQGVEPFDPTPDQAEISADVALIAQESPESSRLHGSFDQARVGDPEYCKQWVAEERERWPETQGTLNRITERIAGETDGHAGFRPEPKDSARALAKIEKHDWDGSRLHDLVGTKIQFEQVADMYRALDAVRNDPELTIVDFTDRLAEPKDSGYRDLQLNVRLPNGHVAELRLHLTHIDEVASYEHALYEVRRDFETFSRKDGREGLLSPEEAALAAALTEQVRGRFEEAFRLGMTSEESG
ncbi:toxin glutamine deamidase domain-containing protein [Amycolatopsis sp. NPDC024027]|uniref:WXG100-like domain-containing protein n=1 Tax=Amycolatopsis sp. NPDC024027 TaxID=3154327 RepID=UPI0034053016